MVQYLIHVLLADVPITTVLVLYAVVFISCLLYLFLLINQRSGVLKEQPPLA